MQLTLPARRLLRLVFALSRGPLSITRARLERQLDVPTGGLNRAIAELSRLGLLDAQRLRLTIPGLAVAAASGAHGTAKPRAPAAKARTASTTRAPLALFSGREAPRAVA